MKTHLKARTLLSTVAAFVLIFSLSGLVSSEASAQGHSMTQGTGQRTWLTYMDKRFDFTIEYPAD